MGLYSGGGDIRYILGANIRDVNWVTYFGWEGAYIREGGLFTGRVLTGFYGVSQYFSIPPSGKQLSNGCVFVYELSGCGF